jgi:hypothetical protein
VDGTLESFLEHRGTAAGGALGGGGFGQRRMRRPGASGNKWRGQGDAQGGGESIGTIKGRQGHHLPPESSEDGDSTGRLWRANSQ